MSGPVSKGPVLLLHAWRISEYPDLIGTGGEFINGRWHTAEIGKPVVYLTEAPAAAILEILVNLEGNTVRFPESYQLLRVNASRPVAIKTLEREEHSYEPLPSRAATAAVGDAWLASGETALARVPAVVAPYTWNYLLNPKHPDAAHVRITSQRRLPFDPRLFQMRS